MNVIDLEIRKTDKIFKLLKHKHEPKFKIHECIKNT